MSVPLRYISNGVRTAINAVDSTFSALWGGSDDARWHSRSMLRVPLEAASGGGGVASVANPFGRACVIGRVFLDRTAGTTGTIDVGVAANGTTTSDTLLDGTAATATLFDNVSDGGVNGKARQRWGLSQFVTATASVAPTGLTGFLYIEVMDP